MPRARRDVLSHGSGAYAPRSSGLLSGSGGLSHFRRRKSAIKGWGKNFPDQMLTNTKLIREEVPDFDPALEFDYTGRELILMAEKMLLTDDRPLGEHPTVLNTPSYRYRVRHEIYTSDGTPDPSLIEGLYWRTHPNGRKFATPDIMRTTGCGFYDGVQETDLEIVPEREPEAPVVVIGCEGPECDRPALSKARPLCAGHRTQFYSGKPLAPLRHQLSMERVQEIKDTWDSGESHAAVSRRLGVSIMTSTRYRQEGQIEALSKISGGRA